jgi:hypothetical protein
MKHMPHHMLPDFPLDWAEGCVHAHLIRHPARVLASYAAKHEHVSYEEIGFAQQEAFFERFPGPVIDSADIRRDPRACCSGSAPRSGCPSPTGCCPGPPGPKPLMAHGVRALVQRRPSLHRVRRGRGSPAPVAPEHAGLHARALPVYEALAARAIRP